VLELAEKMWRKVKGVKTPFRYVCDEPFDHDVQKRIPSVEKARSLLGFEAETSLDDMLDEVIPWVQDAVADGRI
jgi:nucleoside-diphosphate-sugar epimerase